VVVLVGRDHEQRVVLADAVGGQAVERRTWGTSIVPTQVSNTARPGPPGTRHWKKPSAALNMKHGWWTGAPIGDIPVNGFLGYAIHN
jgi:hypothetical protein